MKSIALALMIFVLGIVPASAGGAMMRRQQMQQQKVQQQRLMLQKVRERQMQQAVQKAQQIATQRVIAQQKAAIQKAAIQKAAIEREVAAAQIMAAKQTVAAQQEALKQAAIAQYMANQQITQAQQKAIQQSLLERALKQKVADNALQTSYQAGVHVGQQIAYEQQRYAEAEEIVTLDQLVSALDESGHSWTLMMDMEAKQAVVEHYIQQYQDQGIVIRKPPGFYAQMIDGMAAESPQMLDNPFDRILQILAIIEYDFDNGRDKDVMARQILGEQSYLSNRQRLGLP